MSSRFKRATLAFLLFGLGSPSRAAPRDAMREEFVHLRTLLGVHPGRGQADYPDSGIADVSKSYAMFLAADLRFQPGGKPSRAGHRAGEWLLRNRFSRDRSVVGWGLPFAWDAFGDGTVNPPGTAYTISTAIAIASLLDWYDSDSDAPKDAIRRAVAAAFEPYLDGRVDSPAGFPAYSLEPADRKYDCFNPAAYLAGQAQRFSRLVDGKARVRLEQLADGVVEALLAHRQLAADGSWYWFYSVTEKNPNDLPHASYIIAGLRAYTAHGGALAARLDLPAIDRHLEAFVDRDARRWYSWPKIGERRFPELPRLYDMGMALSLLAPTDERAHALVTSSRFYRNEDGHYVVRPNDRRIVNEYESYWLFGLAHFLAPRAQRRPLATRALQSGPVPFVKYEHRGRNYRLVFDPSTMAGELDGPERPMKLRQGLIPLKVLVTGPESEFIIARRVLTSHVEFLATGSNAEPKLVEAPRLEGMLFRQAALAGSEVLVVMYDPLRSANHLYRFTRSQFGVWVLDPSFERPLYLSAPHSYEHQPRLLTLEEGDTLTLAGAGAVYEYRAGVPAAPLRHFQHVAPTRILEILPTPSGIVALTQRKAGPTSRFELVDLWTGSPVGEPLTEGRLAYGLRLESGRPTVSYAEKATDVLRIVRHDIEKASGSGVMAMGLDNVEGEVVWSQSYFLTGMLDFLTDVAPALGEGPEEIAFIRDVRARLDTEMALLEHLLRTRDHLRSRVFSVNRVPALFAVQTGKMLLLLKRYISLLPDAVLSQRLIAEKAKAVERLEGHMENLATSRGTADGLPAGRLFLEWAKGVPFRFDGVGIPYNHQNCWAAGVLAPMKGHRLGARARDAAIQIAAQVFEYEGFTTAGARHLVPRWNSASPERYYSWLYWWGPAKAGWGTDAGRSVNSPSWQGEPDNIALARYRTFDAIALLMAREAQPAAAPLPLLLYLKEAVESDGLELFLSPYLRAIGLKPHVSGSLGASYVRADSQPDFRNAFLAVDAWL